MVRFSAFFSSSMISASILRFKFSSELFPKLCYMLFSLKKKPIKSEQKYLRSVKQGDCVLWSYHTFNMLTFFPNSKNNIWLSSNLFKYGLFFLFSLKKVLMFIYFWEIGRDRTRTRKGQRGRHRIQSRLQTPGSELSAQSLMRGSNSQTARSWPEPKSDAQLTDPPRHHWISFYKLGAVHIYWSHSRR